MTLFLLGSLAIASAALALVLAKMATRGEDRMDDRWLQVRARRNPDRIEFPPETRQEDIAAFIQVLRPLYDQDEER